MEKLQERIPAKEWFQEVTKSSAIEKQLERQTTHIEINKKPQFDEYEFYNKLETENEKVWFKLYKLQYYRTDEKQFKGTKLAWPTIYTFTCYIRTITKGNKAVDTYCKNMIPVYDFVKRLKDLGVKPFDRYAKQTNSRHLDLKILLNSGKINQIEKDFINGAINAMKVKQELNNHERCGFNKNYQQIVVDNYKRPIREWRHLVPKYSDFTVKRYVTYCNKLASGDFSSTYLNESLAEIFKNTYNIKPTNKSVKIKPVKNNEVIQNNSNLLSGSYGIMKDGKIIVTNDNEQFIEGYINALKDLKVDLSTYKSIKITQLN